MLGARPFALAEDPVLRSGADKIAAKLGVRPPSSLPHRRRLPATLRGGPRAVELGARRLAGALRALRREELEAAIAHELAHVRRRDVLVQTFVVLFATTLVEMSRIGGWFSRFLLYVFAPISAAFVHILLSPKRELHADALAATATGTAHDLADALTAPRPRRRARRVRRIAGDGAALSDRPVRARRRRADVQDAPAARRSRAASPRARRAARTAASPSRHSRSSPGSSENITESRIRPSRVPQVRTEDALAPEPDLLGDALRGHVVGIGEQLDPLELELLERVAREQPQRARARSPARETMQPSSTRASRDSRARLRRCPIPPTTCPSSSIARRCSAAHLATDERKRILLRVRMRNRRDPVRDLGVVAAGDDRRDSSSVHGRSTRSPSRSSTAAV